MQKWTSGQVQPAPSYWRGAWWFGQIRWQEFQTSPELKTTDILDQPSVKIANVTDNMGIFHNKFFVVKYAH